MKVFFDMDTIKEFDCRIISINKLRIALIEVFSGRLYLELFYLAFSSSQNQTKNVDSRFIYKTIFN